MGSSQATFEEHIFNAPVTSLTVNAGDSDDSIIVEALADAGSNPAGPTTFPPENLPIRGMRQKPQRSTDFAVFCVGVEMAGTELLEAN